MCCSVDAGYEMKFKNTIFGCIERSEDAKFGTATNDMKSRRRILIFAQVRVIFKENTFCSQTPMIFTQGTGLSSVSQRRYFRNEIHNRIGL